jgi:carbamate kinase
VKAVVAFGGNAIARADQRGTFGEQLDNVRSMSDALVSLMAEGVHVVVTHGNGPQVGQIALQQDIAEKHSNIPPMPFDAAGAMSEGLIGYMLQQSLANVLRQRGLGATCVTVVTQVIVAPDDPAFQNPTKPVGRFYSKPEAGDLAAEKGWTMVEDAGRGYRRVVPSPRPLEIVEWPAISTLLDSGAMVIAAGGGGIPVVEERSAAGVLELRGIEAVIDKDRASARLAALVGADTLVLLTDVEHVAIGFGTPDERRLERVTLEEMREFHLRGEFPPGSMGPKVESAIRFLDDGGKRSIITSTHNLVQAVTQGGGTEVIHRPLEISNSYSKSPASRRAVESSAPNPPEHDAKLKTAPAHPGRRIEP